MMRDRCKALVASSEAKSVDSRQIEHGSGNEDRVMTVRPEEPGRPGAAHRGHPGAVKCPAPGNIQTYELQ